MMERPLPLVSVGKAVAGTVIIAVLSVFLAPISPILAPFLSLPLVYVVARHGWVAGVVVAVVSAGLLYAGAGPDVALLTFLVVVSVGMTLGWALRSGWRFPRSLAVTSVALLAALVLFGLILWLGFGLGAAELRVEADKSIADVATMYSQVGVDSATISEVTDLFRKLIDVFPYIAPGLLGMVVILVAGATTGLAYLIFPKLRKPQMVRMSLSGFRLHWGLAYVSIIGLAMLLFAQSGSGSRTVMFYAGIDLLFVSQTLFFLQALAVLSWLGKARQWRPGARVLVFVSAVVAQLFQFTGLMGLFDTWIDYRKRFALKGSGPSSLS